MNRIKPNRAASLCGAVGALWAVVATSLFAAEYKVISLHPVDWLSSSGQGGHGLQQVGVVGHPIDDTFEWKDDIHAALWEGSAGSFIDLHPPGYAFSSANDASLTHQVGYGTPMGSGGAPNPTRAHAFLWSGTAESAVNLHPDGFDGSIAVGISGAYQVGTAFVGEMGYNPRAMLWSGTAASAVELHPAGYYHSEAFGIEGTTQVGYGITSGGYLEHALLWKMTAESVVDLNPNGFASSIATGVSSVSQVGYGYPNSSSALARALLWSGTAESAVNLHPNGFKVSFAYDATNFAQVGYGAPESGGTHALVWYGTAESVFDLHPLVKQLYPTALVSYANAISPNGDIFGYTIVNHYQRAVVWRLVPEPRSVGLLAFGIATAFIRRSRS